MLSPIWNFEVCKVSLCSYITINYEQWHFICTVFELFSGAFWSNLIEPLRHRVAFLVKNVGWIVVLLVTQTHFLNWKVLFEIPVLLFGNNTPQNNVLWKRNHKCLCKERFWHLHRGPIAWKCVSRNGVVIKFLPKYCKQNNNYCHFSWQFKIMGFFWVN